VRTLQNVVKRHASALSKDPDTLMAKRVTATLGNEKASAGRGGSHYHEIRWWYLSTIPL
jgi:hypothetical protein